MATPWNVIVHNDPINLMSYVTLVLQRVFGYPRDRAERLMLEVHTRGRSLVWSGGREQAERARVAPANVRKNEPGRVTRHRTSR